MPSKERPELVQPVNEPFRYIPLTKGHTAIVDADIYEELSQFSWMCSGREKWLYAVRKQSGKFIRMHHAVIGKKDGLEVDHINGNPFDNRRENLRHVTHAQNARNKRVHESNTSGYRGVSWDKRHQRWKSAIHCGEKYHFLGYFDSSKEASIAYKAAAKVLFGKYVRQEAA